MKPEGQRIGLPPRPFLYTIDQISVLTELSEVTLHSQHIYHQGRDIGVRKTHQMIAHNISAPDAKPDWRVVEKELIRWFRIKGFKYYNKGTITG